MVCVGFRRSAPQEEAEERSLATVEAFNADLRREDYALMQSAQAT